MYIGSREALYIHKQNWVCIIATNISFINIQLNVCTNLLVYPYYYLFWLWSWLQIDEEQLVS